MTFLVWNRIRNFAPRIVSFCVNYWLSSFLFENAFILKDQRDQRRVLLILNTGPLSSGHVTVQVHESTCGRRKKTCSETLTQPASPCSARWPTSGFSGTKSCHTYCSNKTRFKIRSGQSWAPAASFAVAHQWRCAGILELCFLSEIHKASTLMILFILANKFFHTTIIHKFTDLRGSKKNLYNLIEIMSVTAKKWN